MADYTDILMMQLDKQWSQAKQSEDQRAATTRYIVLLYVAVQGFIVKRGFDHDSLFLAVVIILLGVFGAVFAAKYYERFRLSTCRVGRLMERLEELHPKAILSQLEQTADERHRGRYPVLHRIRLNILWRFLHLCIVLLGITNIIIIWIKWSPTAP